MKEATGDLNMSLIVLVLVGIMAAFFSGTVWPNIKSSVTKGSSCNKATCVGSPNAQGMVSCTLQKNDGTTISVVCPYKG